MHIQYFWAGVIGFLVGTYIASVIHVGWTPIALITITSCGILFASSASKKMYAVLICIALAASSVAIARTESARVSPQQQLDSALETNVTLEGIVADEVDIRENSARLTVRPTHIDGAILKKPPNVLVVGPLHANLAYGDRIRAEGTLRLPKSFETDSGHAFDYPAFLAKDGIVYELAFAKVYTIQKTDQSYWGEGNVVKASALWLKQTYLRGLTMALPEPHASLAGGITAGDKRGLGKELSDVFRDVGLTHIVVLSGYNIMVVVFGLSWLLVRLRTRPLVRLILGIAIAILFALMTGLASASLRASIMAMLAMIGVFTGRTYLASRALGAVAVAMVFWNPHILTADPGFQLSVLATWGILSFSSPISSLIPWVSKTLGLRDIVATTISSQVAVVPLLLYLHGTLSVVSLPANIFVLITMPLAMLTSAVASIFGLLLGPLSPIFAAPAYVLLSYIIFTAHLFSSLPFATVSVGTMSVLWLLLFYGILAFVAWQTRKLRGGDFQQQPN